MRLFARFAWAVLGFNVLVVLWGAFVRATGSGAGCGAHWPLCNGEVLPRAPELATLIEFTHRATSGVALLLVVGLALWARRLFARGHPARRAAAASLTLMIVEALLGAGLVLFGWVAQDTSAARAWVMPIHLANTLLLLGAIALTALLAGRPEGLSLRGRGPLAALLLFGALATLAAAATGAVAALGDTLFPGTRLVDGAGITAEAHALLRLRLFHPFAAIVASIALVACARVALRTGASAGARRAALALVGLVGVELVLGALNVALLAPVWMQMIHLLLAELVWLALIVLAAESLAPGERAAPATRLGAPAIQPG